MCIRDRFIITQASYLTGENITPADCILLDDNIKELFGAEEIGLETLCLDRSWNQEWGGNRIRHLGEFDPFA